MATQPATKKTINDLTSNQYYRGLNKRFDNRVKKMLKRGFVYLKDSNSFNGLYSSVLNAVPAPVVMHCDKRHFEQIISGK